MMFAMLAGFVIRRSVSDEQCQQMPFDATGLGVATVLARRLERLGEVEGHVDGHQRVEGERKQAEPRGPDPASPLSRSHSGAPALGCWCGAILAEW